MPAPVSEISAAIPLAPVAGSGRRPEAGFSSALQEAIQRVEGLRRTAEQDAMKLLAGESEEVHQAALAVQRAELAFELFLEVRNKVVQAYQEIMRMPI